VAGGALDLEGLLLRRVGELLRGFIEQPVAVVVAPGLARAVGPGVLALRVVLQEGIGGAADAQQVALLVDAAAVGHVDGIDPRLVGGVLRVFGAHLERAVLVRVEGRREAHRLHVGGRLLGNQVLVEAAALVVAVQVELGDGLQLLKPVVHGREARHVLQLAGLAHHHDALLVRGLREARVVVVALHALGAADEGGVGRRLAGHLDR
jgi:hypothetical protein